MELLTVLLFLLVFASLPAVLFTIIGRQYGNGMTISKTIFKFCFSFLCYAVLTVSTLFFELLVYIGADPKPSYITPVENKIAGLIAVLIYGIVGWFLCSFLNGEFVRPWMIFRFKGEEPQSIFDTK